MSRHRSWCMSTSFHLPFSLLSALLLQVNSCKEEPAVELEEYPSWPTEVPEGKIDFAKNVRPILIINCLECHNNESAPASGNLSLETRKLALTSGDHPPAIVPGRPDDSLLIKVLTTDELHYGAMPPTPDKIWGVRMEILRRWIEEGAEWPESVRLVHPKDLKEW